MTTHTKKAVGTIQYINYMESCVYAVGKCAFSSKRRVSDSSTAGPQELEDRALKKMNILTVIVSLSRLVSSSALLALFSRCVQTTVIATAGHNQKGNTGQS